MRLAERDRKIVSEVIAAVPAMGDGLRPCLQAVVELLRRALGADAGIACTLESDGARTRATQMFTAGLPSHCAADFSDAIASAPPGWALFEPARPELPQRNVPLTRARLEKITGKGQPWIERTAMERAGLTRLDMLRVLVCDGPALLAWVGAYREKPFTPRDQRMLAALVPALRRRLLLERAAGEAPLMRAALESTMEILPGPAFLVDAKGTLRHVNAAGRAALAAADGTAAALRDAVRGGLPTAQVTPVVARGLARHFLVLLAPPAEPAARRVELARGRWALTQRQVDVLGLLAAGESNKSIAARLGCEVGTVEAHVTALLRKSGSASRTGLVAGLLALPVA